MGLDYKNECAFGESSIVTNYPPLLIISIQEAFETFEKN